MQALACSGEVCARVPLPPNFQQFLHPASLKKSNMKLPGPSSPCAAVPLPPPATVQEPTSEDIPCAHPAVGTASLNCAQISFIPPAQDADSKKSALPEALVTTSSYRLSLGPVLQAPKRVFDFCVPTNLNASPNTQR